jgi:hypothetical protein
VEEVIYMREYIGLFLTLFVEWDEQIDAWTPKMWTFWVVFIFALMVCGMDMS